MQMPRTHCRSTETASPRMRPLSYELKNTSGTERGWLWEYDSRGNLASFCQVPLISKWKITARMWSILKPANKQGQWNQMGKFHIENEKLEGQGRSACGCISCGKGHSLPDWRWAENNKMSKHSWAREGTAAELAKSGSAQTKQLNCWLLQEQESCPDNTGEGEQWGRHRRKLISCWSRNGVGT